VAAVETSLCGLMIVCDTSYSFCISFPRGSWTFMYCPGKFVYYSPVTGSASVGSVGLTWATQEGLKMKHDSVGGLSRSLAVAFWRRKKGRPGCWHGWILVGTFAVSVAHRLHRRERREQGHDKESARYSSFRARFLYLHYGDTVGSVI